MPNKRSTFYATRFNSSRRDRCVCCKQEFKRLSQHLRGSPRCRRAYNKSSVNASSSTSTGNEISPQPTSQRTETITGERNLTLGNQSEPCAVQHNVNSNSNKKNVLKSFLINVPL